MDTLEWDQQHMTSSQHMASGRVGMQYYGASMGLDSYSEVVPPLGSFASSGLDSYSEVVPPLGSFGQLLNYASSGALYNCHLYNVCPPPELSLDESDNLKNVEDTEQIQNDKESNDTSCYYHNSDYEADSSCEGSEDDESDAELQVIDDHIPSNRFMTTPTWIGSDYNEVPCGMDDTITCDEGTDSGFHEAEDSDNMVPHDIQEEPVTEEAGEDRDSLLGGCGCTGNEVTQEIAEQYLASMKAGYQKRIRKHGTEEIPDCRKPREMGAVEIAIRLAGQGGKEHIFEPVMGMVFDSADEGYDFYNMYSWELGFGIVKNKSRNRQSDKKYRTMQELCCERSGKDRRVTVSTKKIKCKARVKMLRTHDGGWYISEFVKIHNHPMAETCSEKRDWFSHKRLDPYTLRLVRYLRLNNVNQTAVRSVVASLFGGLKASPCTKRTIRSICNQISREQMDDDVAKTLELFKQMKSNDPEFQWSVEAVKDSRINTLMWCTGKSREHYACFGDVITFDTTYCTNIYKMPFALFVGVNNHFQTIVFGGVLMRSETTESFEWVFKEFIKLMGGTPPKTVLTDQCKAMTIALGNAWPATFHLWCKWHVLKNIRECLGPTYTKNAEFRDEFYAIINEMLTKQEFDAAWTDLCSRHKLTDNPFMIRTFQCRSKWAKPWAKGNFCAGMTSTQRSESANWMLKRFVPRNASMNHFVSQLNLLLEDRDMEEGREDNLTKQLFVRYNRLWPIERHAVKIYTRQSLKLFRKQVDLASNFKVSACGTGFYVVERNREGVYPEWRKRSYRVHVYDGGARYCCECGYFEHVGMLCCHTIRVMIKLEIGHIPEIHILTRWTRNAKDVVPAHMRSPATKNYVTGTIDIWQRRLNTRALEACTKGNTYRETYGIVMKHLNQAIKEVDEYIQQKKEQGDMQESDTDGLEILTDVEMARSNRYGASGSSAGMSDSEIQNLKGPEIERSRGGQRTKRFMSAAEKGSKRSAKRMCARDKDIDAPPKNRGLPYQTRFCSKCRKPGHNKTKCPLNDSNSNGGKTTDNCTKCGLRGHCDTECLVVDSDSDRFFR